MDLEERLRKFERKTNILIVATIALMASGLVLSLVLGILFSWYNLFGLFSFPATILPLAALALAFYTKLRVGDVAGSPKDTLAALAHRLRVSMFKVANQKDHVVVDLSKENCVKVRVKPLGDRTEIFVQSDLSPFGWSIALVLIFVVPFFGWFLAAWFMVRAIKDSFLFVVQRLIPIISESTGPISVPGRSDVKASLIDSLSEGHRLASEARDGLRSNYEDNVILITVGAIVAAALGLALWAMTANNAIDVSWAAPLLVAVPFGLVLLSALVLWSVVRQTRPRINELGSWADRLNDALAREVSGAPMTEHAPGSLELLLDAWREVPGWLKVRREAGMFREPGTWLVIFILISMGGYLAFVGVLIVVELPGLASLALAGGVVLVLGSIVLYLRWKRRQDEETGWIISEWRSRLDAMMSQMDGYIKGL